MIAIRCIIRDKLNACFIWPTYNIRHGQSVQFCLAKTIDWCKSLFPFDFVSYHITNKVNDEDLAINKQSLELIKL